MKNSRKLAVAIAVTVLTGTMASSPLQARNQTELVGIDGAAPEAMTDLKAVERFNNKIVGAWFGRAVPIDPFCVPGTAGCPVPKEVIMTPTFFADGVFLGSDSLTFSTPHATAFGEWMRTGHRSLEATLVFLQADADSNFIGAFRTRYTGELVADDRLEGFVNVWFFPFVDAAGDAVLDPVTEYPVPDPLTPLGEFITDPAGCRLDQGCIAVLRFVVRRVSVRLDR